MKDVVRKSVDVAAGILLNSVSILHPVIDFADEVISGIEKSSRNRSYEGKRYIDWYVNHYASRYEGTRYDSMIKKENREEI